MPGMGKSSPLVSRLLIGLSALTAGCGSIFDDGAAARRADRAAAHLDVYPGLEATLFASEPMMVSPTNLDVDHLGRVWVIDVVNYRGRSENNERPEGDRILILEDEDHDGRADSSKVYYQGRDIDAALGIALLGNQVIVTAAPNVLVFTDENGDDVPDRKDYLFTNTGLPQNDHSTHSVSFGPDGHLYWNMGNSGLSVHDKDGKLVIDAAGNAIIDRFLWGRLAESPVDERPDYTQGYEDRAKPYIGGMVFRSSLDGGRTEVLAHNFRNNYEVAVDSLGSLWQSDNDDDGNASCRINYLLEFGNYGYRDEITTAGWTADRTGQSEEVPPRHWHQNDPGVVPNLLITGAGSPAGITVYEGRLLPKEFHDQVLHADAGPGVLRAVLSEKRGAGFTAREVNVIKGERDKWVRPVDVAVAPDGSLFVSDWYDPVVGWNRQEDPRRGRIFRIAPTGHDYRVPEFDFGAMDGAAEALRNPASAVRYRAWSKLHQAGAEAERALAALFAPSHDARLRARALWLLSKIKGREARYVEAALADADEDIRVVGVRAARQADIDLIPLVKKLTGDPSPQVRREAALALRGNRSPQAPGLWAELALQHDGNDRWYLEALGIAAEGQWDAFLDAWLPRVGSEWNSPPARDILWRSRARRTPHDLVRLLGSSEVDRAGAERYLRAFDFQSEGSAKSRALRRLALRQAAADSEKGAFAASEALLRMNDLELNPALRRALDRVLPRMRGSGQFARLVQRFQLVEHYPALMEVAVDKKDEPVGIASMKTLLDGGLPQVAENFLRENPDRARDIVEVLGNTRSERAVPILQAVFMDEAAALEVREQAVRSLARFRGGAEVLVDRARQGKFPEDLKATAGKAMTRSMHAFLRKEAESLFPVPPMKNRQPVPGMTDLLVYVGDPEKGRLVFKTATCSDCHVVHGQGTEFGPGLSEIGGKLAKQGLYESILDPSAGISPSYELQLLTLDNNDQVEGFVVNETAGKLTLRMEGGVTAEFSSADVVERRTSSVSAMPTDLQEQMTLDELVDLVEYLTTLK